MAEILGGIRYSKYKYRNPKLPDLLNETTFCDQLLGEIRLGEPNFFPVELVSGAIRLLLELAM